MRLFQAFLIYIIFNLILVSCESSVYHRNITLENREWPKEFKPTFSFTITDIDQDYNIYYNVRNTRSYPFYNLYLKYKLTDLFGVSLKEETDEVLLFDSKTGEPLGTSGLGDIYDHQIKAISNIKFAEPGDYDLEVEQFMRMDTLPEIISIGIKIEKVEG